MNLPISEKYFLGRITLNEFMINCLSGDEKKKQLCGIMCAKT